MARNGTAIMVDDDGRPLAARGGGGGCDRAMRDDDLMRGGRLPVSHRRRDVDRVMVERIVYGRSPLLEAMPCDRVEAVARLRLICPEWDDHSIGIWLGVHPDTVAVHTRGHSRYRYGWLDSKGSRRGST